MSQSAALLEGMQQKLIEAIEADLPHVEDDETFTSMIRAVVHLGPRSTEVDWAREFKISYPTFDRWYRGVSRPVPMIRATVFEHVLNVIKEKMLTAA